MAFFHFITGPFYQCCHLIFQALNYPHPEQKGTPQHPLDPISPRRWSWNWDHAFGEEGLWIAEGKGRCCQCRYTQQLDQDCMQYVSNFVYNANSVTVWSSGLLHCLRSCGHILQLFFWSMSPLRSADIQKCIVMFAFECTYLLHFYFLAAMASCTWSFTFGTVIPTW